MAARIGITVSPVQWIWRAHRLQPHWVRQFKLSRDPEFVAKLRDVVGLYVDPPDHAIVLSVDERSQIQALDRTQPGLPLKPGHCGTTTHDLYEDFFVKRLNFQTRLDISVVENELRDARQLGAEHRATYLYSVDQRVLDHDAVIRIGGRAPKRWVHFLSGP